MAIKGNGVYIQELKRIFGIPIEDIVSGIPTPTSLDGVNGNCDYSDEMNAIDRAFSIEVMRWGQIYGYKQEQSGRKIQNLFPIKKHQAEQISSSSKVTLEMHTEAAFHPYRPDYLSLFCVRGDGAAGTTFSTLSDILNELDEYTKDELRRANFMTRPDASYMAGISGNPMIRTTILSNNDCTLIFDRDLMIGMCTESTNALNRLIDAVEKVKRVVYLEQGQILTLDNEKVVHGRTPFNPRYDGTDRWLKRALIRVIQPPTSDVMWDEDHFVITTDF